MMLLVNGLEVEVRDAKEPDAPLLFEFFRAMAGFEKLTISATEETIREALFGDAPSARALLAIADGKPIGYAVYFFTFSTMHHDGCVRRRSRGGAVAARRRDVRPRVGGTDSDQWMALRQVTA